MTDHSVTQEQRFQWILYDGRAESGDIDDAAVLEAFTSSHDMKQNLFRTWNGHDGVLFEYEARGKELVNERMVGHLREGKRALLTKCSRAPRFKPDPSAPNFSPNFDERGEEPWLR